MRRRCFPGDDNTVEVIVEPDFRGDLRELASRRPVWIVDTSANSATIDAVWEGCEDKDLFEVSRCRYDERLSRTDRLRDIPGCLDDHCPHCNIVVHGISPRELDANWSEEEGFRIAHVTADGFAADQIPEVRDRLMGR